MATDAAKAYASVVPVQSHTFSIRARFSAVMEACVRSAAELSSKISNK